MTLGNIKRLSVFFCFFMTVSVPAQADLELGKLFSDHMVLQRDQANRFWGWADPGEAVEACVAEDCYSVKADSNGAWELALPARPAGGPLGLRVSSGGEAVEISDVYFGDVWLAGGQSNMEWTLANKVNDLEVEYADSDYPLIRFFKVEHRLSVQPEERLANGDWVPASRKTVEDFSAVGWIFAKQNHLQKGVAVGVISNNWGGTPAEAWVSREGLSKLPVYKERAEALNIDPAQLQQLIAENEIATEEKYRRLESKEDAIATGAHRFGYDDSGWKAVDFPTSETFEDLAWLRRGFELEQVPEDGVVLDLGDLVQDAMVFVNEEFIAQENWTVQGSRHELPASLLKQGENLVVLRVGNSWSNRPVVGQYGNMFVLAGENRLDITSGWAYSNTVEPPLPIERRFEHEPSFLYNGMIHPVRRYGVRGVIWYQGESNVGEAQLYGDLFKGLIQDWRSVTGQPLPFFFVQLAGFLKHRHPQADSAWAELRHQQELALELPLTGMATAVDIGEEDDIHPRNKQDVGKRLWLQVRRVVFGEDVPADAPRVESHAVEGDKVVLRFGKQGGALEVRGITGQVEAFALAGEDGIYHPADARLEEGIVIVSSDQVAAPKSLLYAWNDFPRVTLYSEAGLPVLPFRIDRLQSGQQLVK